MEMSRSETQMLVVKKLMMMKNDSIFGTKK